MPLAPFIPEQLTQSLGGMGKHTNMLTHWCFSRGVLQVSQPAAADGHSWEGLVSLGDRHNRQHMCLGVSLCTRVCEELRPKSRLHASLCLHPVHFLLLLSTVGCILSPLHPVAECVSVTRRLSPHQLCQHLFNDGCRSQAELCQQLSGCLSSRAENPAYTPDS